MKLAIVLVGLSVSVMAVMIFQAVRQELNLHNLKTRMVANSAEVKRKEEAIIELKNKIQELKTTLASVNTKMDELKKTKAESEKSTQDLDKSLQTCNTEKDETGNKKTGIAEAITKLKADQEVAKKKAGEDILNLKQQILDRDKALCAFADTTKEEARKLCGNSEAPK
ncbi:tropomyosin-2 [Enoplosus armatus]|uniref:tropomyosin-2 n=1 Tax=Enoplosus armatus TaxID=215367 RepID=UPI0039915881